MREMDITDILRGKSSKDCQCCAYGACECACDVTWPEQVAVEAADEIDRLRAELAEARRLLDEARNQEPASVQYRIVGGSIELAECSPLMRKAVEAFKAENPGLPQYELRELYAAPVPAHPAVPDDAGGDVLCVECGGQGQYWIGEPSDPVAAQCDACGGTGMVSVWVIISQMESVGAGGASHRYVTGWARDLRAILSATDAEGRKDD